METLDELRMKAEQALEIADPPGTAVRISNVSALSVDQIQQAIHELQVHQIELEIQNEELRSTRNELEESRQLYTELYEFAPVGYFTLDRKSMIQQVNLAGSALLSSKRINLLSSPFSRFVHSDDLVTFLRHLKEVFGSGQRLTCDIRLRKNGEIIFVRLMSLGLKDSEGNVATCQTTVTDLTDRRTAEKALEESEVRFRAICESTEEIIIIKDASRRLMYGNPAAASLIQAAALETVADGPHSSIDNRWWQSAAGRKWWQSWLDTDSAESEREMDERVLAGDIVEEEHRRIIGGVPMVFLETRMPLRESSTKITGILFIARDVTDRRLRGFPVLKSDNDYPSEAMQSTLRMAGMAAEKGATVLLLGESGSGKDHLAKYIHKHSPRSGGPYFSINCAALAPELAESELFGHEKGAFTGAVSRKRGLLELAEGGTLLLNEIGELSLPLQSKLLTFLDARKFTRVGGEKEISVNARLIAATNRNLEEDVFKGSFRGDLFYRLNVFPITIPPLRERREDIPLIIDEMLKEIQKELQLPAISPIDEKMMEALLNYSWPGNVRELRNVLERALMLSGHEKITLQNLGISSEGGESTEWSAVTKFPSGESLNDLLEDLKRSLIKEALHRTKGSRQKAAKLLGISRYSLKHYMKTLRIVDEG